MTPLSVFPHVPTPTPIKRTTSRDLAIPPTPSLLFPRDLKSLFSLKPEAAKKLLREYGLASGNSTPLLEKPKMPLEHVEEESATSPGGWDLDVEEPSDEDEVDEENAAEHVEGMNKFMAHIGVRKYCYRFDQLIDARSGSVLDDTSSQTQGAPSAAHPSSAPDVCYH